MSNIYLDNQDRIKQAASDKLMQIISEYVELTPDKKGITYKGNCPSCSANNGLLVTPSKHVFGCSICRNFGGKGDAAAIAFLMKMNQSYVDALENVSRILNLVLIDKQPTQKTTKKSKAKSSFCERWLAESGLVAADVQAKVYFEDENKTSTVSRVFKKGSIAKYGEIDNNGDDVIIEYFDLEGKPIMYELPGVKNRPSGKFKHYTRVRYQFPDEHKEENGKPRKYKTPYGASTQLYIPQIIREAYAKKLSIERLFIQEGEKKAEKSCKHGVMSVGISGIGNLGYKGQMPPDLVKIIQQCGVKEIILLFDSDWNDISSNVKFNDDVQQRPRNFFYAAKNYKDYICTLKNRSLYLEIFIGHVKKNDRNDKGIDDLLANTLKGKEERLKQDINTLINEKEKDGEYLKLYKITTISDLKLQELWCLNNPASFAEAHKEILINLPEFKIGRHSWSFSENGELISVQPIDDDEKFWVEKQKEVKIGDGQTRTEYTYEFAYVNSINFLQNRGFGRYRRLDNTFQFIHITHPTVRVVEAYEIADFVAEFTKSFVQKGVLELLFRGSSQYLGPEKLNRLTFLYPSFEEPRRDSQLFYFKDSCWKISKSKIEVIDYSDVQHQVWSDQINKSPIQRLKSNLLSVTKNENDHFEYTLSKDGEACHMLQFLINTSNFTWNKAKRNIPIEPQEIQENTDHLISKLCAIGYMLLTYKDPNVSRAVVAMDGKQSEVGKSNGRSGKSILGEMFKYLLSTVYIPGKTKTIEDDNFLWDELTEKTKIVFIDDVRSNFSLEFLFANITGAWTANYKGGRRMTFPFSMSPKIYITTNHALNGEGSSFKDRQWLIAFSDYYNDTHKPLDDFGMLFFLEWELDQWTLLWNLMAECVQLYLQYGVVQAPGDRLEDRKRRQFLTEPFIMWAEEYFSSSDHLNQRISRQNMYSDFYDKSAIRDKKYITPKSFKDKIRVFCEWKGYVLNPQMYDPITRLPKKVNEKTGDPITDDKSGGVEYFTVGEWEYLLRNNTQAITPEQMKAYNDMNAARNGNDRPYDI